MGKKLPKLNPKQRAFVKHYLVTGSATEAAKRAGYSEGSAHSTGPRLLEHDGVMAYIEEGQRLLAEKLEVKAEDVISELKNIAFANVKDYYSITEGLPNLDLSTMTRDQAAAISSIKTKRVHMKGDDEGYIDEIELRFHSKPQALEKLGKHLNLFEDKVTHSHEGAIEFVVESKIPGTPGSRVGEPRD